MPSKVNLLEKFAQFDEQWTPKIVGEMEGLELKIAKIDGEFVWHHHDNTDELFYVVRGHLTLQMREGDVDLHEGELYVVPRRVEHRPVAHGETWILMMERSGTLNTGNVVSTRSVQMPERI